MAEGERYHLGFPEMDIQHQYLYRLFDSLETFQGSSLEPLLREIELYVNFHFTSEENLMRLYEYPGFASHQTDHEYAAAKLVSFMENSGDGKQNPAQLRIFLTGWLMEHSKTADADYVSWIEKRRSVLEI